MYVLQVAANPLYAWWRNADIFLVAYDNGSLWSYDVTRQVRVTVKGKDHYSIAGQLIRIDTILLTVIQGSVCCMVISLFCL